MNWFVAHRIHQAPANSTLRQHWLIIGLVLNITLLVAVKYSHFLADNISAVMSWQLDLPAFVLPLRVSFFPRRRARRTAYRYFEERMRRIAQPDELTIDFNDGSFTALTAQPGTFADGVHLTTAPALEVSHILDQRLSPLTTNSIPPSPQAH